MIYIFQHPKTEEYIEISQGMNEDHVYRDEEGVEWRRIFTTPEVSASKICDPWNKNDFINQTGSRKGTMGDLLDQSAEMSEKRAQQNGGVDPIKQQYFKDYSKQRRGLKDPADPSRKKTFENKHIKATFD